MYVHTVDGMKKNIIKFMFLIAAALLCISAIIFVSEILRIHAGTTHLSRSLGFRDPRIIDRPVGHFRSQIKAFGWYGLSKSELKQKLSMAESVVHSEDGMKERYQLKLISGSLFSEDYLYFYVYYDNNGNLIDIVVDNS